MYAWTKLSTSCARLVSSPYVVASPLPSPFDSHRLHPNLSWPVLRLALLYNSFGGAVVLALLVSSKLAPGPILPGMYRTHMVMTKSGLAEMFYMF
jgi:hypothetical protein